MSNMLGAATVPTQALQSTPVTILYKLSNPFSTPLAVPKGGTGIGSYNLGDILYGAGNILATIPIGTIGEVLTNNGIQPNWDSTLNNIQGQIATIISQYNFATTTFTTLNTNAVTYTDSLSNVNDIISQQITNVNALTANSSNQDQNITNENTELQTLETSLVGVTSLSTSIQAEDANTTTIENSLVALNAQLVTVNTNILQAQDNINHLSSNINSFGLYKNKIINGSFSVWQRATNFMGNITSPGYSYLTADRWMILAGTSVIVVNQQVTGILGFNRTATAMHLSFSGVGTKILRHYIEGVRTLQGQSCTLSFWASGPAFTLTLLIKQIIATGPYPPSNIVTVATTTFNITETWTQFYYTFTMGVIPANTAFGVNNSIQINFQSSSNWSINIANVQLEQGPMSTFEYRPYGMELMLCQRYYETGYAYLLGYAYLNTTPLVNCQFKVNKRSVPSVITNIINTSGYTSSIVVNQVTNNQICLGCTKNVYSTDGSFNIMWITDSELIG